MKEKTEKKTEKTKERKKEKKRKEKKRNNISNSCCREWEQNYNKNIFSIKKEISGIKHVF